MKKQSLLLSKWIWIPVLLLLVFTSCRKTGWEDSPDTEKEFNLTGFTRLTAGEKFNLVVNKGTFSIKARGPVNDVNDIEMKVVNNGLEIRYKKYLSYRPEVDIIITMPDFVSIHLSGAATSSVNDFQDIQHVTRAILSGASKLVMNGTGINMQVDISGASQLDVSGNTLSLYGSISGAGKLNAYDLFSDEVDIEVSGGSTAYVNPLNTIYGTATGGSRIYYKGDPPTKHFETSGGGQVIKQ
jgi:hypothetical protein